MKIKLFFMEIYGKIVMTEYYTNKMLSFHRKLTTKCKTIEIDKKCKQTQKSFSKLEIVRQM